MNMGQGIAMFGQSIGDAIRRSREKEKKKKEKEEMRQALLKFGVPESMADMIGGDSELFKNFTQLKQLQLQQDQIAVQREKIEQMGKPSPAETAKILARKNEGEALLKVLNDPKASKAKFGAFSEQWKGGNAEDALQFDQIFGDLEQPEKGSVLKQYMTKGHSYSDLVNGDPKAQETFYAMGGKPSELGSFYKNRQKQEEEAFVPQALTITGEDGKTYPMVQTGPKNYQYVGSEEKGYAPSITEKQRQEMMRLADEGDVLGVKMMTQQFQKTDILGRPLPMPDFVDELLLRAEKNAKK